MRVALITFTVLVSVVLCQATLESVVQKAQQIERLQRILDRIMSPERRSYHPRHGFRHGHYRPMRYPYTGPSYGGQKRPVNVNVNMRVEPPTDRKGLLKAGIVSVFQKDSEKDATGEMEAHWHTEKKEVILDANKNVTRVKSFHDDGEIKKSIGFEKSKKIRKLKAGKMDAKKYVQSIFSPRHWKKDHHKEQKPEQKEGEKKHVKAKTEQEKALEKLIRLYMSAQKASPIPKMGATPTTTAATPVQQQ